jgi:hypothetical protein
MRHRQLAQRRTRTRTHRGDYEKALGSTPKVYCGELLYSDQQETIKVARFIVRNGEIAFDLTTDWGLGEHWNYMGIAKLRKDGAYAAVNVIGKQVVGSSKANESESLPCSIRFKIQSQSVNKIQISGDWFENGEAYSFAGKLEKLTPNKR